MLYVPAGRVGVTPFEGCSRFSPIGEPWNEVGVVNALLSDLVSASVPKWGTGTAVNYRPLHNANLFVALLGGTRSK